MVISTKNMHPNECGGMDWPHTIQTDFGAQLGHAEELQSDTTGDGGMIGRVIVYCTHRRCGARIGCGGAAVMTRHTLNGRPPRTLRDAARDPFDWIDGPHKAALPVSAAMRRIVAAVFAVAAVATVVVQAARVMA